MLIGITGLIGSGKSTIGNHLIDSYGFTRESFASSLKDAVAVLFHWDRNLLEGDTEESRSFRETPDPYWSEHLGGTITPRIILQEMGTEVMRETVHPDFWILSLMKKLQANTSDIVITDVRFPNEVEAIRKLDGFIVNVVRPPMPDWFLDVSDWNTLRRNNITPITSEEDVIFNLGTLGIHPSEYSLLVFGREIKYDYTIINYETLEDLKKKTDIMLSELKGNNNETK